MAINAIGQNREIGRTKGRRRKDDIGARLCGGEQRDGNGVNGARKGEGERDWC